LLNLLDILKNKDISSIYCFGSRVYGCASNNADFDYVVIKKDGPIEQINTENININIYNERDFVIALDNCNIEALECMFLPKDKILKQNFLPKFYIDKSKLRHAISEKASHSFVKAKKKFIIEQDRNIYIGKKSLFHALRIVDFGIQIATHGKIIDYSSSNYLWYQIMNNQSEQWQDYNDMYKPVLNNLLSNFRQLAPK